MYPVGVLAARRHEARMYDRFTLSVTVPMHSRAMSKKTTLISIWNWSSSRTAVAAL